MTNKRVVVIGGGIVGAAAAYYFAEAGWTDVLLVEAEHFGAGATGGSFGGIRQQFAHPLEIEFSRRGLEFWKTAAETFDAPCDFHQDGYLLLTSRPEVAEGLANAASTQRSLGMTDVEMLDADGISALVPWLTTDDLVAGCWTPKDGHVLPMDGLTALVKAARLRDVEFRERWPVAAITKTEGLWQVHGPETVDAEVVVVAAGAGTRQLLKPYGIDLDIRIVDHLAMLTETAFPGEHVPMMIDLDSGLCVEREGQGLVLAMLGRNPPPNDYMDLSERFFQAAVQRAPVLTDISVVKYFKAHPTIGGDGMPYVGEVEPGLWAIAFVGHGAMHGPPLAETVVAKITGLSDVVDLTPWDLRRTLGEPTVWWRKEATG